MPQTIFLDTGYVIALINTKDQYHTRAISLANQYDTFPMLTTSGVLLEIGNALSKNHKRESVQVLHHLLNHENIVIVHLTPDLLNLAFDRYQRYLDKQWGFVDCLSFITMEKYALRQVLTFDRHFTQAGFEVLQP